MSTSGLTIVFDNYPFKPGLTSLWGFAAVIHLSELTILFDTGSNGRVLLRNMDMLGLDPGAVDMLFLSHAHWDHIGGLDSFLEINHTATVLVHEGFSTHLIQDLDTLCGKLIVVSGDIGKLAPGIYSTGILDDSPPEQAMVLETKDSTIVIGGCAHPGMEWIVQHVKSRLSKNVHLAVGGFHLMNGSKPSIEQSVACLRDLGVEYVLPTHCTGDTAKASFQRAYGTHYLEGGIGYTIAFDHLGN